MKIKKFDSINVIPFIDIMLVLLAIVLTFSTFIAKGDIKLNLPKAESGAKQNSDVKTTDISINKDGLIYLDKNVVTIDDLKAKIVELKNSENIFLLRADKDSNFGAFVQVIDILKANKIEKISIQTELGN